MADRNVPRKLAAILAADVVGYSRLIGADEEGTIARLRSLREEVIDPSIAKHGGRIVKTTGDGLLVEFASVVDAARNAVEVQLAMADRNARCPGDQRIEFRIGINLGDIVVEGDDILGDGVNVAARLEGLAATGGICISDRVYADVHGRLEVGFEDLGEQKLKNIAEPVRVYRMLLDPTQSGKTFGKTGYARNKWTLSAAALVLLVVIAGGGLWGWRTWAPDVEPASIERMAFPLPEVPSIAVLPFDNLSGDPNQDPLIDAITDNVTTTLARLPRVFVIAKESTSPYKDQPIELRKVAEDLGIRYLLKSSFQRAGDKVRVTAQLSDALAGRHLWAESYDRVIQDIFTIQDEIALNVAAALQVMLSEGEKAEIVRPPTKSLEAWKLSIQAHTYSQQWTGEGKAKARELLARAIELDPDFLAAWVNIGWTHWADVRFGWTNSPEDSLRLALEAAERARSINPGHPDPYSLLSGVYLIKGEHDKALTYGEKALTLNPNSAENLATHAMTQIFAGEPEAAERSVKQAMRLNPAYPGWYLLPLQEAYRLTGRYDEAIETVQEELRRLDMFFTRTRLALYYAQSGRDDQARAEIKRVLQVKPDMNLEYWANAQFFKDPMQNQRDMADLRRVGLPE